MGDMHYKPEQLAAAESRYRTVQLETRQRDLVNFLGTWFSKRIGMQELACRGYWVLAVVQWQLKQQKPISVLESYQPEQRIAAARQIAEEFRALVTKALADNDKQATLQAAIKDGMLEYVRLYARL